VTRRYRENVATCFIIFLPLVLLGPEVNLNPLCRMAKIRQKNRANVDVAHVTFVIPSTLQRSSLNDTIMSLKHQTVLSWEAVVGLDTRKSKYKKWSKIRRRTKKFLHDDRIRYVAINTTSSRRGKWGNGAGHVRNAIILHPLENQNDEANETYHRGQWVAFVDDDDTVHPRYLEYLQQGVQAHPEAEVIIFRMRILNYCDFQELPPLNHSQIVRQNHVGISFAVRRDLMRRERNPMHFHTSDVEDFDFLHRSSKQGAQVWISNCVAYFVRHSAPTENFWKVHYPQNKGNSCSFAKAQIESGQKAC